MVTAITFKLLVVFAAFAGFLIAGYIHHTKKKKEVMVCPLGTECDSVVKSKYSVFFGVDTTVWGMLYYLGTAVFYGVLVILGENMPAELAFIAFGVSILAVLFSAYLTSIQAFVLREWCTWCLISAALSVAILVFTVFGVSFELPVLLAKHKPVIVILHALSAALGVGAVTVTDFFFFKFLRDYKVSRSENATMKLLSQFIWIALGLLVLTGIGLYIPNAETLLETPKFLVKSVLVGLLVINGVVLNIIITPHLMDISFGEHAERLPKKLQVIRSIAFASGAFSITTWYAVFLFGSIRKWPGTFWQIFGVYLAIIFVVIVGSQIFNRLISKGKVHL